MIKIRTAAALAGAVLMSAGCSADSASPNRASSDAGPSIASPVHPATSGSVAFAPTAFGSSTDDSGGTVLELREDLAALQRAINRLDGQLQRNYIQNERMELQRLADAIRQGEPGYSRKSHAAGEDRPLVIIHFDDPDVQYEQPLYEAMSQALERRPEASFEVVAVSPDGGASAESLRHADRVAESMTEMGLPASRLRRSSAEGGRGPAGEVHIFVR